MITTKNVKDALDKGVMKIVYDNLYGIVCKCGEYSFYFGGVTADEYDNVEDYLKDIPEEAIVNDVFETLNDFRRYDCDAWEEYYDEYLYYVHILNENGIKVEE